MNKEKIIENMISFVEEAEKDLQAATLAGEMKTAKTDIVNRILNELESEINNEN